MPAFRLCPDLALIDRHDPQHGDARHPARLVECAARGAVDQSLVGHVLQERFEHDLVVAMKPESARNLALAGRLPGLLDEGEDLLSGGQAGRRFAGHYCALNVIASEAKQSSAKKDCRVAALLATTAISAVPPALPRA